MARPSTQRMKHLVSRNTIVKNMPFTTTDLTNSDALLGPVSGAIQGKSEEKAKQSAAGSGSSDTIAIV
jgi:hypothetical protein